MMIMTIKMMVMEGIFVTETSCLWQHHCWKRFHLSSLAKSNALHLFLSGFVMYYSWQNIFTLSNNMGCTGSKREVEKVDYVSWITVISLNWIRNLKHSPSLPALSEFEIWIIWSILQVCFGSFISRPYHRPSPSWGFSRAMPRTVVNHDSWIANRMELGDTNYALTASICMRGVLLNFYTLAILTFISGRL